MKAIHETHRQELVAETALELKKIDVIKAPEWSIFVKTGTSKQRPPVENDWWYTRAASVLIKTMRKGPIGVSKLRVVYGSKKRRGHKPPEFRLSSGNILRKIIQQLEKAELVKQAEVSGHKGRVIAPKGVSLVNSAAKNAAKKIKKEMPAQKAKQEAVPNAAELKEKKAQKPDAKAAKEKNKSNARGDMQIKENNPEKKAPAGNENEQAGKMQEKTGGQAQ